MSTTVHVIWHKGETCQARTCFSAAAIMMQGSYALTSPCRVGATHRVSSWLSACFVAQAEVSYEYLRGTCDQASYLGPSRVLINKRKRRTGPKATLEYLSQQNHSLLSHDNVWAPTTGASPQGKSLNLQLFLAAEFETSALSATTWLLPAAWCRPQHSLAGVLLRLWSPTWLSAVLWPAGLGSALPQKVWACTPNARLSNRLCSNNSNRLP